MKAACSLLEFRHIIIDPKLNVHRAHAETTRAITIQNRKVSLALGHSPLQHYFPRLAEHYFLKWLNYMENVLLVWTLPITLESYPKSCPLDDESPFGYAIRLGKSDDKMFVTRIRFSSPLNVEHFALGSLLW